MIDPRAFVSQSSVIGVYGEGFDQIKVKVKKHETPQSQKSPTQTPQSPTPEPAQSATQPPQSPTPEPLPRREGSDMQGSSNE